MDTVSLHGLTKTTLKKREMKSLFSQLKGTIKTYNDFGKEEYKVFLMGYHTIGALDINTDEVWLNLKIINL